MKDKTKKFLKIILFAENIKVHKHKRKWYKYFKIKRLNYVTQTEDEPAIYRWLFWTWEVWV